MKCSKLAAKHIFIRKKAAFAENPEALLPNNPAAQKILRRYCQTTLQRRKNPFFLTCNPPAPSQKRISTAIKHAQRQGEG